MAGLPALLLCLLAFCMAALLQLRCGLNECNKISIGCTTTIGASSLGQVHEGTWHNSIYWVPDWTSRHCNGLPGSLRVGIAPMAYVHSIELAQGNTDCVHACTSAEGTCPVL